MDRERMGVGAAVLAVGEHLGGDAPPAGLEGSDDDPEIEMATRTYPVACYGREGLLLAATRTEVRHWRVFKEVPLANCGRCVRIREPHVSQGDDGADTWPLQADRVDRQRRVAGVGAAVEQVAVLPAGPRDQRAEPGAVLGRERGRGGGGAGAGQN